MDCQPSFDWPHGPADAIKHREDGLLVKNGHIKAFANAIIYLIENIKKRKEMGAKAKVNVMRHISEKIVHMCDSLFKSLVK